MKGADPRLLLHTLYGEDNWPAPFHALRALELVQEGTPIDDAVRRQRTTRRRIDALLSANNPFKDVVGVDWNDISSEAVAKSRRGLAQLLVGRAAELAFEDFYRQEMGTQEFELRDLREGRSDTDYRLLNGQKRPLYRINIKFIGSSFRRAPELVGLQPEDCFPLATYKIFNALKKQEQEHLPYIFLVVFVRTLNVDLIASHIPDKFAEFMAVLRTSPKTGLPRRDTEDRIITWTAQQRSPAFTLTYDRVRLAEWYVLSARKADKLLRDQLFDRVYGLRIRGFAQQFRSAELDMHFSLESDLVPLTFFSNCCATRVKRSWRPCLSVEQSSKIKRYALSMQVVTA